MKKYETVTAYIDAQVEWHHELTLLREIIQKTALEETVKWGAPCYTLNGKNVLGMMAFKKYAGLWFHNGVFLKDPAKKLVNAQEGVTKALRQWRFSSIEEMDPQLIEAYILEAIENQKAGKIHQPSEKTFEMPNELETALSKNMKAKDQFNQLTPFKQKEYKEYILSAKQDATKLKRIEKIIPMIEGGLGLHDKYR